MLAGGSGTRRITRSNVILLTGTANRSTSREPARPPSAIATAWTTPAAGRVRLPCRVVSPGTCSTNVFFVQSGWSQNKRRTVNTIITSLPPMPASAS